MYYEDNNNNLDNLGGGDMGSLRIRGKIKGFQIDGPFFFALFLKL